MEQLDVGNAGHSSTDQGPPQTGKEFTANSFDNLLDQLIEHFRSVTNIEIRPLKVNKKNEQRVKQNEDHKETDGKHLKQEVHPKARTKNKKKKKQDSTSITNNKVAAQSNENPSADGSKEDTKFPPYWILNDVQEGLKQGTLLKGPIRISTKSSQRAFVTNENSFEPDHLFTSELDRNRALEGDIVAFQFKSDKDSIKKRKTMVVVHILERVHSRITVGHLQPMPSNNKQFIMLIPRDYRLPRIRVPATDCPDFYKNTTKFANMLFKAKISSWSDTRYAVGSIVDTLGLSTNLEAETAALLVENDLDVTPFPSEILQDIPLPSEIPVTELLSRKDLRKECIFTIDPLSAHDLDDAVSCKVLSNGNFEIGVHIADVTFYLIEDSPLDKIIWKKATTIYLMDKVYHMLPEGLCKQCSFTPGTDKLAFSVFWEMTRSGTVVRHHFARTVINSCAQLAYEQAQFMIENPNNYKIQPHNLRPIFRGFTYRDLHRVVNHLHKLAVILRQERFKKGALSMGLPKVMLKLDEHNGEPCGYFLSEYKEAHKLVEEFMLLANTFVAQKIVEDFPNHALLRCHQPPNQYMLNKLHKTLDGYAIGIDIKSSKTLQSSIINAQNNYKLDDAAMAVLHYLVAKTMRRAEYFCSANVKSDDFHHYALSMPIYTHFTSPIRRYADVVAHRLLASSLGYSKKRQWKLKHLTEVATSCNRQKFNAKSANDASVKVHLARYIFKNCPFVQNAAVVGIGNNYLEVLIAITGTIVRIYPKKADDDVKCSHKQHLIPKKLELVLPETDKFPQENCSIYLFSIVQVILYPIPRKMQFRAKLWRPVNVRSLLPHPFVI